MTTARPRNPRLVSTACVALALVATTAAARAPRPQSLGAQVAPAAAPRVATPLAPQRATPAPAVVVTPAIAPALAPAPASARRMAPAIEPAVAPAPAAAVASAASVQSVVPARVSGEPIPIEVIRALLAKYHPNVLRGDASVNLVAFVLDANGNYVLSTTAFQATDTAVDQDMQATRARLEEVRASTGRGRGGRGSAPSASMDSAAAALRAAAESLTVVAAAARGGVIRSTGSTTTTTTRYVGDTVFVKRTTTTFGPGSALADLVDEKTIESVEIRKLPAGVLGPLPVGVIIVQLKR